jgi:hypothetical protein
MQLTDASKALTAAGLSAIGDHLTHMGAALTASTPVLENLLGTPFAAAERFDWFSYKPSRLPQGKFQEVRLLLTQGLVAADEPFLVYETDRTLAEFAPVLQDASNATLLVEGEHYFIDHDRGTVTILKAVTQGTGSLMIRYTAGLRVDSAGVAQDTPDWLAQAAAAGAIRWSLAMQSKWNNKERVDLTPEVASIFRFHINEKIRSRYGEFPIRTVTV